MEPSRRESGAEPPQTAPDDAAQDAGSQHDAVGNRIVIVLVAFSVFMFVVALAGLILIVRPR
jgi:hypothetical protein